MEEIMANLAQTNPSINPKPADHVGHPIEVVDFGKGVVAVECLTCYVTVYREQTTKDSKVTHHIGHNVEIVTYGNATRVWNVSIECVDCGEVIYDEDITSP
jgi:hypothetical protein